LVEYAARQPGALVLVPDDPDLNLADLPEAELVHVGGGKASDRR
jgi:hypothetical protein